MPSRIWIISKMLIRVPGRALTVGRNLYHECSCCTREAKDVRSGLQLILDFVLYRLVPYIPTRLRNRERQVELKNDVKLRYRLNRGDIQSIREIWLDHAYRLPFPVSNGLLVDLGANIGLTSVWLTKEYGFSNVIAIEPDPGNARLVRKNFELNGISGKVLEAAVGPHDCTSRFRPANDSNQGRLSHEGHLVTVVSMNSVIKSFGLNGVDLIKMDIEGGEQALLTGPQEWLSKTKAIIAEFHPDLVDHVYLIRILEEAGFEYIGANTAFENNMDSFHRRVNSAVASTNA